MYFRCLEQLTGVALLQVLLSRQAQGATSCSGNAEVDGASRDFPCSGLQGCQNTGPSTACRSKHCQGPGLGPSRQLPFVQLLPGAVASAPPSKSPLRAQAPGKEQTAGMPEGWSLAVGTTTSASDKQPFVQPPSWHTCHQTCYDPT